MSSVDVCKTDKPPTVATTKSASPWAKIAIPESAVYSLENVMSEQLANDLQEKENVDYLKHENLILEKLGNEKPETLSSTTKDEIPDKDSTIDSDYLVAQLLQLELDKEYDEQLRNRENFANKNSRGKDEPHYLKKIYQTHFSTLK